MPRQAVSCLSSPTLKRQSQATARLGLKTLVADRRLGPWDRQWRHSQQLHLLCFREASNHVPYLDRFDPPSLDKAATTLRKQYELGLVFHGRALPLSPSATRLLMTYLITTDKSGREYIAGCIQMQAHMEGKGIQPYVESLGHFENCINSAKRALRAFGRLGTQEDGLSLDRTIRRLAQSRTKLVTDLRDAIEHMDGDITSDAGIPEGAPHLLTFDKTGEYLEVGVQRITLIALKGVVMSLHQAGEAIILSLPARN